MFHPIPDPVLARMRHLEALDAADRRDGTPRSHRLRQITPDTGRFLAILATMAPEGAWVEIGTSGGYSGLWLALACRERGGGQRLTTVDIDARKVAIARETFHEARVSDVVDVVHGDGRALLAGCAPIALCFLDAEKEVYGELYEAAVPRLVPGGVLIADNAISHAGALAPMLDHALGDTRVDALVVPIGKGELVCRKR